MDRKRVRDRRLYLEKTLQEVADEIGVSRATVQRYESGVIKDVGSDALERLAVSLNTTPAYLMGWDDNADNKGFDNITPIKKHRIPLLGDIACGEPIYAEQDFECYVDAGAGIRADFALRCRGDSMINAGIRDGSIVFVRQQDMVNNGEIAAVIIDDEATLKRVYITEGMVTLNAENPAYAPIIVRENDGKNVRILGKAIAYQSDII